MRASSPGSSVPQLGSARATRPEDSNSISNTSSVESRHARFSWRRPRRYALERTARRAPVIRISIACSAVDPESDVPRDLLEVVHLGVAVLEAIEVDEIQHRVISRQAVDHIERVERRTVRGVGRYRTIWAGDADLAFSQQQTGHQSGTPRRC